MKSLIPLFRTSGDICPEFQSMYAIHSSDSPLVWHLLASWQSAGQTNFFDLHIYICWRGSKQWSSMPQHKALNQSATPTRLNVFEMFSGINGSLCNFRFCIILKSIFMLYFFYYRIYFYLFLEEEKSKSRQWRTFHRTMSEATKAQYPPGAKNSEKLALKERKAWNKIITRPK